MLLLNRRSCWQNCDCDRMLFNYSTLMFDFVYLTTWITRRTAGCRSTRSNTISARVITARTETTWRTTRVWTGWARTATTWITWWCRTWDAFDGTGIASDATGAVNGWEIRWYGHWKWKIRQVGVCILPNGTGSWRWWIARFAHRTIA